jgi:hypothetical protein
MNAATTQPKGIQIVDNLLSYEKERYVAELAKLLRELVLPLIDRNLIGYKAFNHVLGLLELGISISKEQFDEANRILLEAEFKSSTKPNASALYAIWAASAAISAAYQPSEIRTKHVLNNIRQAIVLDDHARLPKSYLNQIVWLKIEEQILPLTKTKGYESTSLQRHP